jgi:ABC-type phosphate/phosphonate transport system ATPase subunit
MTMIEIIAGEKGKGKTKELLNKVNGSVDSVSGNIVYLDKSQKHMYELSNKVRLINVTDYLVEDCDEFLGFICGIISQDNDLEEMYLDSFLTIAAVETDEEICHAIKKLDVISEKFNVKFVLSVSRNEDKLPDCAKAKIVISL